MTTLRRAAIWGAAIAAAASAWILVKQEVLRFGPRWAWLDPVLFTIFAVVGLTAAIRERQRVEGGRITFGAGVRTGVAVGVAQALLSAAFFAAAFVVVGSKWMEQSGELAPGQPVGPVLAQAYAGLIVGTIVIDTVLSVIVTAIVRRRAGA